MKAWFDRKGMYSSSARPTQEELEADKMKTEQDLIDALKKMNDDYAKKEQEERKQSAEDALPEMPDTKHKTYEGDSEEEIIEKTNTKYEAEKEGKEQVLKEDTAAKTDSLENKKTENYEDFEKKKQEIQSSLENSLSENKDNMLRNGLSRSSIEKLAGDKAIKQADEMIASAKAEADAVARKYDVEIEGLNKELEAAIADMNAEYFVKISSEIDDLIAKRDKEINSITEYNNKIEEAIAQYKLKREQAIQDDIKNTIQNDAARAEYESKYGYQGEKAQNYKQRLNLAVAFYNSFDPETAKQMILNNHYLKSYLGYEYNNLLTDVYNRK